MSKNDQNRRDFIKTGAAGLASIALFRNAKGEMTILPDGDPFPELVEVTITELQARLGSGKLTARRLTEMYIERINQIDHKTRSVVEINPDARQIADELDRERKKGKVRSMLHGIPILIKDNIDTADKMLTTAGSLALVDAPKPKEDAFVVQQLRKAGAIIVGKANLSEWANFRSTRSISGWSGRGLQTNNPYFLDQNPCGSSSGSGVAVSANLVAGAVGTETNGSIICPAVTNGVVGLKPTVGLVSRSGIIPISHTQDTAGPMTRTVADAAIMLTAMAGTDPSDPVTAEADKRRAKDYTKFLDPQGLKGARLGLLMTPPTRPALAEAWKAFFEPFVNKLREAGATLIEVKFPDAPQGTGGDQTAVLQWEFKAGVNKYLAARGSKHKTLEDLIKFNDENKETELPKFGQEIFTQSQARSDLTDKAYLDTLARMRKQAREDGIDALLTQHKLDALVRPTGAWGVAAIAGYPSITVPLGIRDVPAVPAAGNAPAVASSKQLTGMLFFGGAWSEPSLLKYAYAFEQLTKGRVTPQFIPTMPREGGPGPA
jgi:amidase